MSMSLFPVELFFVMTKFFSFDLWYLVCLWCFWGFARVLACNLSNKAEQAFSLQYVRYTSANGTDQWIHACSSDFPSRRLWVIDTVQGWGVEVAPMTNTQTNYRIKSDRCKCLPTNASFTFQLRAAMSCHLLSCSTEAFNQRLRSSKAPIKNQLFS